MTDEFRQYVMSLNALPYLGRPEDIANACLYLSSEEAHYVTGTTICVNGGAAY
jgi:NAD(P)-dependent dehydrogenase (short-subunit alcohol dehydrogenase family)